MSCSSCPPIPNLAAKYLAKEIGKRLDKLYEELELNIPEEGASNFVESDSGLFNKIAPRVPLINLVAEYKLDWPSTYSLREFARLFNRFIRRNKDLYALLAGGLESKKRLTEEFENHPNGKRKLSELLEPIDTALKKLRKNMVDEAVDLAKEISDPLYDEIMDG